MKSHEMGKNINLEVINIYAVEYYTFCAHEKP